MKAAERRPAARLLAALCRESPARLSPEGDDYLLASAGERPRRIPAVLVRDLLARGLIARSGGAFVASDLAAAWMKRGESDVLPFRRQHDTIESAPPPVPSGTDVLVNRDESPVATLARRVGAGGAPWLQPHCVAVAERLRQDFEIGNLQPRVTANWSASVATSGRRDGGGGVDLTEAALSARRRVDRALVAVGPELSGVLIDVCCLLKGLETVERERHWPARSAKLVLRIALESLARHYGYSEAASGPVRSKEPRHWGTGDYRPRIS